MGGKAIGQIEICTNDTIPLHQMKRDRFYIVTVINIHGCPDDFAGVFSIMTSRKLFSLFQDVLILSDESLPMAFIFLFFHSKTNVLRKPVQDLDCGFLPVHHTKLPDQIGARSVLSHHLALSEPPSHQTRQTNDQTNALRLESRIQTGCPYRIELLQ